MMSEEGIQKRPSRRKVSVRLGEGLVDTLEKLAVRTKMPLSRVIELCISLGLGRFEALYVRREDSMPAQEGKKHGVSGEALAEAYMRNVLFSKRSGWNEV